MLNAYTRHMSALCAAITLALLLGCTTGPPKAARGAELTDEQQIKSVLDHLRDDIDHRRLQRVLAAVSDNYKDDARRDYNAVRDLTAAYFRDYRDIRITRTPPKITINRDEARSIETLGIAGEPASGKVPPFTYQGNVSVTLRRVQDTWQVTKVQLL